MSKYQSGDIVEGIVSGIQHYGAFVLIDGRINGLIHISEIAPDFIKNIEDYLKIGDIIKVKILEIDEENARAKLSVKNVLDFAIKKERHRPFTNKIKKGNYSFDTLKDLLEEIIDEQYERIGDKGMLKVDLSHANVESELYAFQEKVNQIHQMIQQKSGLGNDFLGWVDWPVNYDAEEIMKIDEAAKKIINNYDTLVVCGIGGSYLGAASAIEILKGLFAKSPVEIIFLGNTFSPSYTYDALKYLENRNFVINVISKSGTTTETSIAFRLLKELAIAKYGKEEAYKRIYATTDKERGALKNEADINGYPTFVIPDDIGGRYSVLTAVGLLPIAVAGVNVRDCLTGAAKARMDFNNPELKTNEAYKYAISRYILHKRGYVAELFVTYEPQYAKLAEWWKQLFGESEGKEQKGLLPCSVSYSTDLHSLGQFVQDGSKVLFETIFYVEQPLDDVTVSYDVKNLDKLNYLSGKKLSYVNKQAMLGTLDAHENVGKVPNLIINLDKIDAFNYGYLVYFFELACAMSAYMLEVNPFNQPGVEVYKANMFKLLGKI